MCHRIKLPPFATKNLTNWRSTISVRVGKTSPVSRPVCINVCYGGKVISEGSVPSEPSHRRRVERRVRRQTVSTYAPKLLV